MQMYIDSPAHQPLRRITSPTQPGAYAGGDYTSRHGANQTSVKYSGGTPQTYTVEDAIEAIGLGWFQVKIFVVGKMITVIIRTTVKL